MEDLEIASENPNSIPGKIASIVPMSHQAHTHHSGLASSSVVKIEQTQSSDGPGSDAWSTGQDSRPDRRMARKAELARESRKRKKVYVQTLQEKARRYASKVEALERRETRALASLGLSSVSRDEQHRRMEQNEILRAMALKIDSRPEGKADAEAIKKLLRKFTENSRKRQAQVSGLFDKVKECVVPELQAKFALWILSQDDRFYEESSFWPSLAYQELGISIDQAEKLKTLRKEVANRRNNLDQTLSKLETVRGEAIVNMTSLNKAMDKLMSHLNTEQQAKFAVWVAKNKWCMEMMSVLWGKH
mmetsp:Transcript_24618/g.34221  ORF Transcript_24618/g.34221 Transcript_24618/m.34221 type:complete len:304 (-) Transcript_24618:189-1100(-)|eukprot:jgi/Bigna1/90284/estExt_fgenesh1_pg.C_660101